MTNPARAVWRVAAGLAFAAFMVPMGAWAYPEFHTFIEKNSGRHADCAMCHAHPDGPEGPKAGQIGSLKPDELDQLNLARAAFEPGQGAHNPILNAFGNRIIDAVGKREFLLMRQDPAKLAEALGQTNDLDNDGIPDADEFLDGTNPVDSHHGAPWRLFFINLRRYAFHIAMLTSATGLGLYALRCLIRGFDALQSAAQRKVAE